MRSFTLASLQRKEVGWGKNLLPFVSAYPAKSATTVLGYRPNYTIYCGLCVRLVDCHFETPAGHFTLCKSEDMFSDVRLNKQHVAQSAKE
jgi:hypothetical protein